MSIFYLALASVALVVAGGETNTPLLEIVGILVLTFSWWYVAKERLEAEAEEEEEGAEE